MIVSAALVYSLAGCATSQWPPLKKALPNGGYLKPGMAGKEFVGDLEYCDGVAEKAKPSPITGLRTTYSSDALIGFASNMIFILVDVARLSAAEKAAKVDAHINCMNIKVYEYVQLENDQAALFRTAGRDPVQLDTAIEAIAARRDFADWAKARSTYKSAPLIQFAKAYPNTGLADAARTRADFLMWQESLAANDAESYDAYLSAFPEGAFVEAANKQKSRLL